MYIFNSGLDPAGTAVFDQADEDIRLEPNDANFVDVIHTNAMGPVFPVGINRTCGDVDFWVHGGRMQPGCDDVDIDIRDRCAHDIVYEYYIESINGDCPFTSDFCFSEEDAKNVSN